MCGQVGGRPAHRVLVLAVDEPVDRALEPLPGDPGEVVALVEAEAGPVRAERLQPDVPDLIVARRAGDHRVRVAPLGLHGCDELERRALPAERHLEDDPPQPAVVIVVAGIQDVDALDHRRVVGPAVVVLEQRPDARSRMRHLEGVAMLAHENSPLDLRFGSMILTELLVEPAELEARTGWAIKPLGACLGDICVPLPERARRDDGRIRAEALTERLGMPLVADPDHKVWALGPATKGTG